METVYIYPHGVTGQILGTMIACLYDCPIHYIDDGAPETSLQAHAALLRERHITVLVPRSLDNTNTADVLCAKLRAEGIAYNDNALEEFALQTIEAIDSIVRERSKPTIAIEMTGIADDKHIGIIDSELLRLCDDVQILYLCKLPEPFAKVRAHIAGRENCFMFMLPYFYFKHLSSVQALITTTMAALKNPHVPTFYVGHALINWTSYSQEFLDSKRDCYDYACVAGEDFAPKPPLDSHIPSGYLGFDRIAHALPSSLVLPPPPRKIILFCPYNMNEMWKMFGFAKAALEHYDVRFRLRYRHAGEPSSNWDNEGMEQILAQLLQYPNFSIDENKQITTQTYLETFCCVCGTTTMRYTYPLLALRPSIALADNPRALPRALGVVLDTNADMEFMEIVHGIYAAQQTWHESLLRYREQKIYHFGGASTWLAKFILQRLGLLQNARL